jgi:hypothetical protein
VRTWRQLEFEEFIKRWTFLGGLALLLLGLLLPRMAACWPVRRAGRGAAAAAGKED